MTRLQMFNEMPTIGYWSALGGVELKGIEHGVEDYALVIANAWGGKKSAHRVRVHYEYRVPHIVVKDTRLYFDDCIRA